VCTTGTAEPVWIGYRDGALWRDTESDEIAVVAWAEMPQVPAAVPAKGLMMDSGQLRELAERLQPMAAAPVFDGLDIPALCDFLRQCADQRNEPHQMLCATHYCKDCAALWRQHDDRSFSLCSQTYCMACNNTPVGGQLFALTTPVAAVPQPEPSEARPLDDDEISRIA